ncbi:MAG: hypothetical protein U0572_03010 [Phycisphaerales bacterium]
MGHEYQDRVSLELARRVAEGLAQHPEWVEFARANLDRWSERNADAPGLLRCYGEWRAILARPVDEIRSTLLAETDDGQRLRQSSPFAGIVPFATVWEIKRRLRDEATST